MAFLSHLRTIRKPVLFGGLGLLVLVVGLLVASTLLRRSMTHELAKDVYQPPKQLVADWEKGPDLPDLTGYTADAIRGKIPAATSGELTLEELETLPELDNSLKVDALPTIRLAQMSIWPSAIYVKSGHHTLSDVLKNPAFSNFITSEGSIATLKVPLVVGFGASLAITDKDVTELRLASGSMAMIVSGGTLYLSKTKVTGWDTEGGKEATLKDPKAFRPFVDVVNGGAIYAAETTFAHLGYQTDGATGVSITATDALIKARKDLKRPTGWLIGCRFEGLYHGTYIHEADDVVLADNTYDGNVVYGINLQDNDLRPILIRNETTGAKEKHGILLSKGIRDGWLIENQSHNNKGSGIVFDRDIANMRLVGNTVAGNKLDGITFYKSHDNLSWKNTIRDNKRDGVRIRSSKGVLILKDDILNNGNFGIEAYTSKDGQDMRTAFVVRGANVKGNASGAFKLTDVSEARFSQLGLDLVGTDVLRGDAVNGSSIVLDALLSGKPDVILKLQ